MTCWFTRVKSMYDDNLIDHELTEVISDCQNLTRKHFVPPEHSERSIVLKPELLGVMVENLSSLYLLAME